MAYVMRVTDGPSFYNRPFPFAGQYVRSYDVDAFGGRGDCRFTDQLDKALRFANGADALSAWNTTSKVRPLREDGQPNKPLTAFTVEIMPEGDAMAEHLRVRP